METVESLAPSSAKPRTPLSPGPAPGATPPGACEPIAALNAMDPRTPVPLQPMMAWHQKQNMQDHLVAVQQILEGLAIEDWESVAKGAKRIGSSPKMARMCHHMGAGADGFTDLALEFHSRADRILGAVDMRDVKAALKATAHTVAACTSCHAMYRQDVVDAETWQLRTGSDFRPPTAGHGHGPGGSGH